MKKITIIAFVALLAIAVTINIGAVSSGSTSVPSGSTSAYSYGSAISSIASSETSGVTDVSDASSELSSVSSETNTSSNTSDPYAPTMTKEEAVIEWTKKVVGYADQFYTETGYTAEQKAAADAALAQIYESLYLDENGDTEETKLVKKNAEEYIKKEIWGLSFSDESVMLMNYVSLTNLKNTGDIIFDPTYTGNDTGVFTALVKDENGRIVFSIQIQPYENSTKPLSFIGESTDLKAHAVKAYELLKTTDLDLSKTTATYFKMNDFDTMYYLTDGVSQYFLTFGSTNKASGELYFSWENATGISNEDRMNIYRYDEMLNLIKNFDTSSMEDHSIGYGIAMGDGTDSLSTTPAAETPAQITSNPIWLWSVVVIAVVALALVIVFTARKKKKI